MSKWKRFKNWLIRKLGGYTEEQTKIVEKIVEKPIDEVQFTYYRAEPVCVKSRISLNRYETKAFSQNKMFQDHTKQICRRKQSKDNTNCSFISKRNLCFI